MRTLRSSKTASHKPSSSSPAGRISRRTELHIGLLFDTSGSMDADIKMSRSAAIKFLNTMNYARDMTLVDFDTEVRVTKFSQQDFPRLVERSVRAPERPAKERDALGVYSRRRRGRRRAQDSVIFTDGGDTRSAIRFGDAMTLIRASDVMVYAMGSCRISPAARGRISASADADGDRKRGSAFFPTTMKEIEEAHDTIVSQVRAHTFGYVSTNTATDGHWRKVEIRVRQPAGNGVRIQARKGYFAPFRN